VIGVLGGLIVGLVGAIAGLPWLLLGFVVPAAYALLVIAASVVAAREGVRVGLLYLVVLPCIHFGWGSGFVLGFFALTRNITAQTGR
jgi:hypothetical protein